MDPQSSYDAWSMQQAWQSANDDTVPIGAQGTQTFHAFQDAQSHPQQHQLQQQHQQQQHQQQQQQHQQPYRHYEQQQPQHQLMASHHLQQYNADPMSGAAPASSSYPAQPNTVDANMMRELQAMYPNAHPDMLVQAIMHPSAHGLQPANVFPAAVPQPPQVPLQHQQWQGAAPASQASYQPSSFAPAPTAYNGQAQLPPDVYSDQSGHSLADALRFTPTASSMPAGPTTSLHATPASSDADAPGEKKKPKLRQLKLTSLLGVAQSVSMEGQQPLPSTSSTTHPTTSGTAESATEPRTPPLPPARVMAAKPASLSGATTEAAATQSNAAKPLATADSLLWSKAKQPLGRLSVERDPNTSARQLIKILCEFDAEGRFRRPVSTGGEVRKSLVETLHAIATLEKGKGFSETGRKKFFGAWMASPAGRHILSTWLRQTVPPKKVTEGAPDLSRRYRDTLLPLLAILDYVPMRKAYLTDEAGLGKAITGVSLRAVDPGARKLAESLKIKWTKVIEAEDSTSTSSSKASPPAASTASAAAKRKPSDAAGTSESSTKRYKTVTSTTATAAGTAKTVKAASAASASAKPGLSFFGADSMKKPATASSKVASGATGTNRMSAGQSVMNFLGTLSGGNSGSSSGNQAAGRQAKEAEGKAGTQEKKKVKKRVTWKEDSELVAVRLIEPADYGQDDAQHAELLEKGLEGVEHDEGDALRQSFSTMEAQTDWYEPREVEVPEMMEVVLGSESVEGPFQTRRHAELEEVVYAEGEAPTSPDESQLELPGTISEAPEELKGVESVEIPTPWVGEADDTGGQDYAYGDEAGMPEVKTEESIAGAAAASGSDGGVPSQADIGALLSKVGPLVGANTSSAPSSEAAASSAPAAAPAGLNFDINVLKSIVDRAKSSGPAASAVNAAMASQQVTTDGISSLLSSLSAKGHGVGARQVEESYPGEYNHDYVRTSNAAPQYGGGHQAYQQPPRYDYGNNAPAWSGSHPNQYGGYGGGGGSTAGAWQSKLHTKPCKFFAMGNCFRGDSCHFRHDASDAWGDQQ